MTDRPFWTPDPPRPEEEPIAPVGDEPAQPVPDDPPWPLTQPAAVTAAEATEQESPGAVDPEPRPAQTVGRRRIGVMILVVAVLAVVTGLGVCGATGYRDARSEVDNLRAVERAAGEFGDALLTFDYRNLEPTRRRVLALATGNFRQQYDQAFQQGALEELLQTARSQSVAEVRHVYVGGLEDHTATAIVVVDARPVTAAGPQAPVTNYVQLALVKVGGRWLVDGVTNLNLGARAPGATTTVAPPPE